MNKLFLIFRQSEKAKPKSRPLSQSTPQESKVSPRMSVRGTVGKVNIIDKEKNSVSPFFSVKV